jgi:hypothetical protein
MKNIHILPTDKPSKLFYNVGGTLLYTSYGNHNGVNIYITNDEEDINENDYIITKDGRLVHVSYLLSKDVYSASKVILATDQDLNKDGVQAIDDEFLEWFVKNPSCESVKFWRFHGINTSIAEVNAISGDGSLNWQGRGDLRDYKIIIPQEGMNCWSGKKGVEGWPGKEEPKQETLEEVKPPIGKFIIDNAVSIQGTDGAYYHYSEVCKLLRLQQEQDKNKYSEEDMMESFIEGYKQRAEKSDLIFDNASRMYAIALFEQYRNN